MTERGSKPGRRPRSLSRATELRAKLVVWREQPENGRKSLRAFASELGTSHQLLNFYLRGLDKWQRKEYQRKAKNLRAYAEAEGRLMSDAEQQQVLAYDRAADRAMANYLISDIIRSCLTEVKRGTKLPPIMLSALRDYAHRGDRKALEVIKRVFQSARHVASVCTE